jgi:CBS domain-containing protein
MTNIKQHMTSPVFRCHPETTLSEVAHIMWDKDCGFVPVTAKGSDRLLGVITDRDACMGAFMQGRPLHEILTKEVMTGRVIACRDTDDIGAVHELMRKHQVRRLPVTDATQALVGVVSISDLAVQASTGAKKPALQETASTLGEISKHRLPVRVTAQSAG